jgi:hypothetical protein
MSRIKKYWKLIVLPMLLITTVLGWLGFHHISQAMIVSVNELGDAMQSNVISLIVVHSEWIEVGFLDGTTAKVDLDPESLQRFDPPFEYDLIPEDL